MEVTPVPVRCLPNKSRGVRKHGLIFGLWCNKKKKELFYSGIALGHAGIMYWDMSGSAYWHRCGEFTRAMSFDLSNTEAVRVYETLAVSEKIKLLGMGKDLCDE